VFRRRQATTHGQLMREELAESFQHLRMAAAHAAGGTASLVGPRVDAAGKSVKPKLRKAGGATLATIAPLALAARSGIREAEKAARKGKAKLTRKEPSVKRWPMMLGGLLVAGAAVGAAGAMIARRRANRSQWEEYGTTRSTTSRTDSMIESAKSTMETGKERVQSLAESAKERAAELVGNSPSGSTTSTAPGSIATGSGVSGSTTGATNRPSPSGSTGSTADFGSREDLYGKAGSSSNNSRS
jgi:hypothetical protein